VRLRGYVDELLRSGFPGIRDLAPRAWLAGYAAATSTDAPFTAILDAATAGAADKSVRQKADIYREHLERLFLLDPLPTWIPSFAPLCRLTHTPKHHLVDPALAARLVGVGAEGC
jgi:hypothetical protein